MPVRWQITGGKNCRFAGAVPLKIFLHQMVTSKNRLSPQIDKNVENPFQCRFAAFAIRDDFVKKSGCCVALYPSSLQRTTKYASLLRVRAPCLRTFYEVVLHSRLLRLFRRASFVATKEISRSSVKPSSAFQENLRYPFFTQLDGDQERRGLPDVAAGKEIVDF